MIEPSRIAAALNLRADFDVLRGIVAEAGGLKGLAESCAAAAAKFAASMEKRPVAPAIGNWAFAHLAHSKETKNG